MTQPVSKTRRLFVGGPWHSHIEDVPPTTHALNVADPNGPGDGLTAITTYYRKRYLVDSAPIEVFAAGNPTPRDVLDALARAARVDIDHHAPPTDTAL